MCHAILLPSNTTASFKATNTSLSNAHHPEQQHSLQCALDTLSAQAAFPPLYVQGAAMPAFIVVHSEQLSVLAIDTQELANAIQGLQEVGGAAVIRWVWGCCHAGLSHTGI